MQAQKSGSGLIAGVAAAASVLALALVAIAFVHYRKLGRRKGAPPDTIRGDKDSSGSTSNSGGSYAAGRDDSDAREAKKAGKQRARKGLSSLVSAIKAATSVMGHKPDEDDDRGDDAAHPTSGQGATTIASLARGLRPSQMDTAVGGANSLIRRFSRSTGGGAGSAGGAAAPRNGRAPPALEEQDDDLADLFSAVEESFTRQQQRGRATAAAAVAAQRTADAGNELVMGPDGLVPIKHLEKAPSDGSGEPSRLFEPSSSSSAPRAPLCHANSIGRDGGGGEGRASARTSYADRSSGNSGQSSYFNMYATSGGEAGAPAMGALPIPPGTQEARRSTSLAARAPPPAELMNEDDLGSCRGSPSAGPKLWKAGSLGHTPAYPRECLNSPSLRPLASVASGARLSPMSGLGLPMSGLGLQSGGRLAPLGQSPKCGERPEGRGDDGQMEDERGSAASIVLSGGVLAPPPSRLTKHMWD